MAHLKGEDPKLSSLHKFLQGHPDIDCVTPTSASYASMRATYIIDNPAIPLAIVRPKTAQDVSALVKHAISNNIEFVVRSGGNNLFGKSQVHGALTIDMRDIAYVAIDEGRTWARIGGGVLNGAVGAALSKEGLITSVGPIPWIGYVGWSTYGGYGLLSPRFGLGVDQILAAKVVNADGDVVDADATMLKGIRGAGGNFGVIVELSIKVYPLQQMLAGAIMFDSSDIGSLIQNFDVEYEKLRESNLPSELGIQQIVMNTPQGRIFAALFMWASEDIETGQKYHTKFASLGKHVMDTVAPTTLAAWQDSAADLGLRNAYGAIRTISLRKWTPEVAEIISRHLNRMPDDQGVAFSVHELKGESTKPRRDSCFGSREPHYMLEFIESATTPVAAKTNKEWGEAFLLELKGSDPNNILPGTYVSLTPEGTVSLSDIYGPGYGELMELKKRYDSSNVFKNSFPRLLS